jgi:hypothetical protein
MGEDNIIVYTYWCREFGRGATNVGTVGSWYGWSGKYKEQTREIRVINLAGDYERNKHLEREAIWAVGTVQLAAGCHIDVAWLPFLGFVVRCAV